MIIDLKDVKKANKEYAIFKLNWKLFQLRLRQLWDAAFGESRNKINIHDGVLSEVWALILV